MERGEEILTAILMIAGLVVAGVGANRLLGYKAWHTGARTVVWLDAEGEPVSEELRSYGIGCHGDIRLVSLVDGERVWTTCTGSEALPHGAVARIDPAGGIGETVWRMPPELPLGWMVAMAPGPDGALGVVYRAGDDTRTMAVAVAGPAGWVRAPEQLLPKEESRLLGVAWREGKLEVAVLPASGTPLTTLGATPVIYVYPEVGPRSERVSPRGKLCAMLVMPPESGPASAGSVVPAVEAPDWDRCQVQAAYTRDDGGPWRFLVEDGLKERVWDVTESGDAGPSTIGLHRLEYFFTDLSISGRLVDSALAVESALQADGSFAPPVAPPSVPDELTPWAGHYLRVGNGIRYVPSWLVSGAIDFIHQIGERPILLAHVVSEADDDELLTLQDLSAFSAGSSPVNVIARAHSFACSDLTQGAFVPRTGGGWWLVHPSGCYLALNADGSRRDPLSIVEHLRRRGSTGVDWNHWWYLWYLAFVLAGLPIALFVAWFSAWLTARQRRIPVRATLIRHAWIAVGLYAVIGLFLLGELGSVMR